jgi:hypothetical protein
MGSHVEADTSEETLQIVRYASRALAMTPFATVISGDGDDPFDPDS